MSRVYWVRHGPTHEKCFTGHRDVPADLSDAKAVARLAAYLPDEATVVASDLVRASATADAIAGARLRLSDARALREFDFGDWDGLHWTEVSRRWPELCRSYWEAPGDLSPPNGESWNAAAARVSGAIDLVLSTHGGPIVAVAHMGVILTQVQRGLGVTAVEAMGHRIEPLSVTLVDYNAGAVPLINHMP